MDNRITAIPHALRRHSNAGTGHRAHLGRRAEHAARADRGPGGDILTVNGGNGKLVETTPAGMQIARRFLDTSGSPKGAGALFGLAVAPYAAGLYYVDDAVNTLRLLH